MKAKAKGHSGAARARESRRFLFPGDLPIRSPGATRSLDQAAIRPPSIRQPPVRPLYGLLPAIAAALAAAAVHAAPLETITVTGSREDQALDDALQDITVIDRATIEAHAGSSLESLLAEQAGIQVATSGGIGSVSSVFIRGANSDSTLLLIDGVRYGSSTAGGPVFYNLPLEQIDHIEIVRGSLSSLYGSDAAGGVIQVFTRRGQEGFQAGASATVGSDAYGALGATVRGGANHLDYAVSAGMQRTDGYPSTNPHVAYGEYNPNRDGFRQDSGSFNIGYGFLPGWSVRVQALAARGDVQFADGYDPTQPGLTARSRLDTTTGGVSVQGEVVPGWATRLRIGASRDNYDTDVAVSAYDLGEFTTLQQTASWQNDIATPAGTLLAGLENRHESVGSNTTSFPIDSRTTNGMQLGLNGKAGTQNWQANLRSDDNSEFGHQTTGALAYGWDFMPGWRLGFAAGTSFVAPSFDDLYYPGFGNPALLPQHGRSAEINLRWKTATQTLRLAAFDNQYRDLIALDSNYFPVNVARSRIRGADLEYDAHAGAVSFGSVLEVMDPRDLTDGTQLPHRAHGSLTLKADWGFAAGWDAGARVQALGQRFDDTANLQTLGGYGLLGLHCDWRPAPAWQLSARVDNVTGHFYEPAYGFNGTPRQWFLTVRYTGG